MKTLETDVEIGADGSVRLLSPLPAWLKPGRAHVLMTVESVEEIPQRWKLTATPEMIARRVTALAEIRKLDPYRDITDPVEWHVKCARIACCRAASGGNRRTKANRHIRVDFKNPS
ncbi:MAG: hypothetical protein ABIS50_06445 [Luteolibacter sp.]|uniref:hypothetical protein n=1 Tax=Luteolibacter sp. TaxID=1962973 RepID=UPI003263C828